MVVRKLNPNKHAAEKHASREKDREDLRTGRATAAEINKRNLFLGLANFDRAAIIDYGPGSGKRGPAEK